MGQHHRVRFGILATTQAWTGDPAVDSTADRGELPLGGPGRRALLALLLLDAGRTVGTERLVDGLYGETPPNNVANALQSQVSRLRRVLAQVGATIEGGPGYGCRYRRTRSTRTSSSGSPPRAGPRWPPVRRHRRMWHSPRRSGCGAASRSSTSAARRSPPGTWSA
jgi:hypothetical protein